MKRPYAQLKLWEKIIDAQLLILTAIGIVALITLKVGGENAMWIDVLINIGCSAVTSIGLSIFIYYKYLKRIPDENCKQIEELLDKRLNYEATNHNATIHNISSNHNALMQCLNPDNRSLSSEHGKILDNVVSIKTKLKINEALDAEKRSALNINEKAITESVSHLGMLAEMLKDVSYDNHKLKDENEQLRIRIQELLKDNGRSKPKNEPVPSNQRSREMDLEW